ncbi:caspase family protein [Methyloceanibacter sp.]|uniref:caspase family protein n=1 Tax=Methyloceanibacter sp. TaxID=1965321 RepID=UPI003D6C785D
MSTTVMRQLALFLLAGFGVILTSFTTEARICLVTGNAAILVANQNYKDGISDLQNPKRDVEAVASAFKKLGWARQIEFDLTRDQLLKLPISVCEPDVLLFYYAGEGVTVDGVPYIAPTDIDASSMKMAKKRLVPITAIAQQLSRVANQIILVIDGTALDQGVVPAIDRSLAALPKVKFALFSAGPGQNVLDQIAGEQEDMSPFAHAFAEAVESKWPDLDAVMLEVRDKVSKVTNGAETPDWYRAIGASELVQKLSAGPLEAAEQPAVSPIDSPTEPMSPSPQERASLQGNTGRIVPPADSVALAAFNALDVNCARCHQIGRLTRSSPYGEFGDVLRLDEIARDPHLISPGDPLASLLFQRILSGEEPLDCSVDFDCDHMPTKEEVAAIHDWIKSLPASETPR